MAEKYSLQRDGLPPLVFSGQLVAEADSQSHQGPCQNRWHTVRIYRTAAGKLVGQVVFSSRWQGESDTHSVTVATEQTDLTRWLADYDPCAGWSGHPPGSQDAERKNRLLTDTVSRAYRQCVSAVLAGAGIEEIVE